MRPLPKKRGPARYHCPRDVARVIGILVLSAVFLTAVPPCIAKIYKFKKDGVWYYTDTPPKEMLKESEVMVESGKAPAAPSTGRSLLLKDHHARNAIEEAAAATVAVKTALGYGSGFFISDAGHIVTNKHVVRTLETQARKVDTFFDDVDNRLGNIEKRFAEEQERLNDYAAKLDRLRTTADAERDRTRKQSYENEYNYRKKEYESWKADYEKRKKKFEAEKRKYQSGKGNYEYNSSVANLSRSFTIVLVDNTELYVHLVAVSQKHDLALLKLDGYQTPALTPGMPRQLAQGDPVYAIGNPAKLRNTVTSGIFSGFAGSFIQTNAQINPGNSGGPLIDPAGRVLGVNTKKKVGNAIEGLGFAIPIHTVLKEFGSHLP
jgi:S1-C subfamily serine protease